MSTMLLDIIYFICAFTAIFFLMPHAKQLSTKILSELRIKYRLKNIRSPDTVIENFEEKESIGLSSSGPTFNDSVILSYFARKNPELIEDMKTLLTKAGLREDDALEQFMKSKINASIALSFIIMFLVFGNEMDIPIWGTILGSIVLGAIGGYKLTDINMEMVANKRKEAIEHGVPDLVDLLVICTESGLDLNRSIRRVAREMKTSNPTLADELVLTSIELEMIPDSRVVFENLEKRTDCLEIKTISKTMIQSVEYGSSLADSLKELAVETRQRRMLEAEGKAAQAPTLLTLPMMVFIMPCLFIVMLGPVIISVIRSFNGNG